MPTTEAGKRLLQARLEEFGDLCDDGLANRERLPFMEQVYRDDIDAIEAEATRDMVPVGKAVESIVATKNEAVAAERARLRERIGKIEEALRIGAICFNGDSWYASRDALGEDGYDLDVAEKIIADALAAVVAIEKGLL